MQLAHVIALASSAFILVACAPTNQADANDSPISIDSALMGDVKSMVARADGKFDVTCKDGSTQVATLDDLRASNVCGTPHGKYVFVSRAQSPGELTFRSKSGRSAGDARCQTYAEAAGLPGTYRAWLSSAGITEADAIDHINGTGPWTLVGSTSVAFANHGQLGGYPLAPLDRDEYGTLTPGAEYWTGTQNGGSSDRTSQCMNWTASTDYYSASYGGNGATSWTAARESRCNVPRSLLCFQIDATP